MRVVVYHNLHRVHQYNNQYHSRLINNRRIFHLLLMRMVMLRMIYPSKVCCLI